VFYKLKKIIEDLKNDSSSISKIEILRENLQQDKDLKNIFFYTYNSFYQFFVTSSVCEKNKNLLKLKYENIFNLLDDLRLRKITGHEAISCVNGFISKNLEYKDLIYSIIDKDLKTRAGEKLINKAIPNLIPTFSVALSDKYDPKIVNWSDGWFVSQKLDGCRCIAVIDENGNSLFFSRTGKAFETLSVISEEIKSLNLSNMVLDGEICLIDENGNEDFQGIMKEIRKKNHTIKNPSYKVFDIISHEEFFTQKGNKNNIFSIRLNNLKKIIKNLNHISVLEQEFLKDENYFNDWIKKSKENKWEGLMIRKDLPYKGKRSKDLLKYKSFYDDEYKVKNVEIGPFRYVLNGKEIEEEMLSCVVVEHKGHEVRVGSGFTIDQRKDFYKNPNKILNKIICVQYFEETYSQEGGVSLRFPTFKYLYGDSRDI
jgi:DNA ligase-1